MGFPPPVGFGFGFPLGLGFNQIGFWVEGGADICSKVPTDGGSVTTIAGRKVTGKSDGAFVGGGAEERGGEGSGSGQSLVQIASLLQ